MWLQWLHAEIHVQISKIDAKVFILHIAEELREWTLIRPINLRSFETKQSIASRHTLTSLLQLNLFIEQKNTRWDVTERTSTRVYCHLIHIHVLTRRETPYPCAFQWIARAELTVNYVHKESILSDDGLLYLKSIFVSIFQFLAIHSIAQSVRVNRTFPLGTFYKLAPNIWLWLWFSTVIALIEAWKRESNFDTKEFKSIQIHFGPISLEKFTYKLPQSFVQFYVECGPIANRTKSYITQELDVENKIEFALGFDSDVCETRHTSRQHATRQNKRQPKELKSDTCLVGILRRATQILHFIKHDMNG